VHTFYVYLKDVLENGGFHLFLAFFVFVWTVWIAKTLVATRYRPFIDQEDVTADLRTSVIVPVFDESPFLFRRVLSSINANEPAELIVVVDGGDPEAARVAREHTEKVYLLPKRGKRAAVEYGVEVSDPTTDVIAIVDSDTVWEVGMLRRLLRAFADARVGGVTPRQSILARDRNNVRRLADWLEDVRYGLTVPAQSVFGQVGCLAGRTIAYRRAACEPAVERLVAQRVFGIPMHIGDDRVLTNEILRMGWRTVYQSSARVQTDAPNTWRAFWKQQLRWGRSSQRETILSLGWLWKRPFALLCFASDIVIPFLLYAVLVTAVVRMALGVPSPLDAPILVQLGLAYLGMITSIGIRQIPHFARYPKDALALPIFVLQVTFFMAPTRIIAFATMFHQNWHTRGHDRRRRGGRKMRPARLDAEQAEVSIASTGAG
jgi:hyaluronan synthase